MVANGLFRRDLRRVFFWEQSSDLVAGPRVWERLRADGGNVALLFWQQSLGESADRIVSPAPVHLHHGGLIPALYGKPRDFADSLTRATGRPFRLWQYWGPLASARSSRWIADAACALLTAPALAPAPDLCFVYLPALDYDLQRHGPRSAAAGRALDSLLADLARILRAAAEAGADTLCFGDYAIVECPGGPCFPNRLLAREGWLATRAIRGRELLDAHESRAFAVADHEVAHVYLRDPADADRARRLLEAAEGVGRVLAGGDLAAAGIAHPNAGDLVLEAAPGRWFAYPWWTSRAAAPDFAAHVDIHNKPGYDPCELFAGWPPGAVSTDPRRVRGSHGRGGAGRDVAVLATDPALCAESLLAVAHRLAAWLNQPA
jgi:predicted AlkP superfamily pyrophosphatase or phosphodiesterase